MNIDDRLTAVLITHYSPRDSYGDLAPPSTGIVSETIESATAKIKGLEKSNIDIFYFCPTDESQEATEYQSNLEAYTKQNEGMRLYLGKNCGLRINLSTILDQIDTQYTLFLEHDWRFIERANLYKILEVMDEYSRVNYIRFDMYKNVVKKWNTVVEPDPNLPIPMCKVSSFTNQPHISRTEKLIDWANQAAPSLTDWILALQRDPYPEKLTLSDLRRIIREKYWENREHIFRYDDFEYFIDTNFKHSIKKHGFQHSHHKYGTYLYGPHASGPYVEHLGR